MSPWKWLPALLFSVSAAAAPSTAASRACDERELSEIAFAPDSITPAHEIKTQLDAAASWAARNLNGILVLDGRAEGSDQQGGDIKLALRRAVVVRDMLTRAGVNSGQIVIAAFGSDHNAADVTIWATHESLDDVIARLADADEIMLSGSELSHSDAVDALADRDRPAGFACAADAPPASPAVVSQASERATTGTKR